MNIETRKQKALEIMKKLQNLEERFGRMERCFNKFTNTNRFFFYNRPYRTKWEEFWRLCRNDRYGSKYC